MKKIIFVLLLLNSLSYSQNRYSQVSTSEYKPMSLNDMMIVPQNLSNKHNENQKYLYSLKNWILELKPQVSEKSFIDRLNNQYNDLAKIENKDLSKAAQYLQQTENAIREIISDYNIYVVEFNRQNQTITNNSSENFIQVAIKYFNEKDFAKSVATFSKYLENNKNNTDVLFYRAMAKSELNDLTGAIADYDKVIELNSNYPLQYNKLATVYNNKAYALVRLKKHKEALPYVQKALELDNTEWFIWDTRGEIYYKLGYYDKSLKDLDKAIELKENENSYFLRGLIYTKLGMKDKGNTDLLKAGELGNILAYDILKKFDATKDYLVSKENNIYLYKATFDNPIIDVFLRSQPNINSKEIHKCSKDATVFVINDSDTQYYKVSVDGNVGYVSKSLLKRE